MVAHSLFISDLHLDDSRPEITSLFLRFLEGAARQADALYILGDLFEYWLGDDVTTPLSEQVADGIAGLVADGVPCSFIQGNRDFLLGTAYASLCGMSLLADETVIDLHSRPTLLLHGDQLCTDDAVYQQVRQQVRDPAWKAAFMEKTPAERVAFARDARQQSAEYKQGVNEAIMDVNTKAVAQAFRRHGVNRMIHGHTHRPAIHQAMVDEQPAQRAVLGDWYTQGSVLRVSADQLELEELPLG